MSITDGLVRYLAIRDQQRADAVRDTLATMTDRERALVREAAVMGYVTGARTHAHRDRIPPDADILAEVVGACLAMDDLYPTIAGRTTDA
jgi:hypothetical protein